MKDLFYLTYRKLRPAMGIPVAFVLMSGAFLGGIDSRLLISAIGFLFIDLFGNFYNDYWDFEEDIRNKRNDKFTTRGYIDRKNALRLSILLVIMGVILLVYGDYRLLFAGLLYTFFLAGYSHNAVRLKGKIRGYAAVAFPLALIPISLSSAIEETMLRAVLLSFFFFFQYVYILCQKDSTDTKDETNLFLRHGWAKASNITAIFGGTAFIFMLFVFLEYPIFIPVFLIGLFSKASNIYMIRRNTIVRAKRSNLMLMEFLGHYIFVLGGSLWV